MNVEYKAYICDQCGAEFEAPKIRVYEDSDIVFCRKKCYVQYMDEWGDACNSELMDALPGTRDIDEILWYSQGFVGG